MADDIFKLGGGLDLVSDYLDKKPGACLSAVNYQPGLNGGYDYLIGYEALDGRPSPSEQTYLAMTVADASVFTLEDPITGVTSSAAGVVIAIDTDSNTIGVTKVTGTFVNGESVTATNIVTVLGTGLGPSGLDELWLLAAQNLYRDDIEQVPGSGSILGVHVHRGVKYVWRNNAGGTAAELYKSTSSGWDKVDFGFYLLFDAGVGPGIGIEEGQTINGQTSGATGVVKRVVHYRGTWGTDAEGYIIFQSITGTFSDGENLRVGATVFGSADGTQVAVTFGPGGAFQMISHNFYAEDATYSIYGADGVNPAWELRDDGTMTPIYLPPGEDNIPESNTPSLVEAHRGHLFLMFDEGGVQHSVIGEPVTFSGFLGAGLFGLGAPGTNMQSEAGGALILTTSRSTHALFGSTVDNWELRLISADTGAAFGTGKMLMSFLGLDDRGLVFLPRTDAFGNFEAGTVSRRIKPLVDDYRGRSIGSVLVRDRNQHRLFFDDGSFLISYLREDPYSRSGAKIEFTQGQYAFTPTCFANGEAADGSEVVLAGSDDGWVYQLDKGTNHNGEEYEAWFILAFSHAKNPRIRKRYRRAFIDLQATTKVQIRISAELQYGNPDKLNPRTVSDESFGGPGGYWGVSNWGEFYWGSPTITNIYYPLTGTGVNISLTFYVKSAITGPHSVSSVQIEYDPRRRERNA